MDRIDPPPARSLLRQIQHAAGLDPDGPRLVPMRPLLSQEQAVQAAHRAAKVVVRDAMLRRALGTTFGEQYTQDHQVALQLGESRH